MTIIKRMSKVNWRRKDKVKIRKPVPMIPNRIITPDVVYDRNRFKGKLKKMYDKYMEE